MSARNWQTRFDVHHTYEDSVKRKYDSTSVNRKTEKLIKQKPFINLLKEKLHTKKTIYVLILLSVFLWLYWAYLTSLYLIDEVYDSKGPKELTISERFTIRLTVSKASKNEYIKNNNNYKKLLDTIQSYSICPSVAAIQLIWPYNNEHSGGSGNNGKVKLPPIDEIQYTKTHCPVTIDTDTRVDSKVDSDKLLDYSTSLPTITDGVLLLDSSVLISCNDLRFAYSVWRSGKTAMVGFYPRLHQYQYQHENEHTTTTSSESQLESDPKSSTTVTSTSTTNKSKYSYYGKYHVWWNSIYSILLPVGTFVEKTILQKSSNSNELKKILNENPQCYHVGLSVWGASQGMSPPIWVKVPVSSSGSGGLEADIDVTPDQHGKCLELLMTVLNVKNIDMKYNSVKAIRASDTIFW